MLTHTPHSHTFSRTHTQRSQFRAPSFFCPLCLGTSRESRALPRPLPSLLPTNQPTIRFLPCFPLRACALCSPGLCVRFALPPFRLPSAFALRAVRAHSRAYYQPTNPAQPNGAYCSPFPPRRALFYGGWAAGCLGAVTGSQGVASATSILPTSAPSLLAPGAPPPRHDRLSWLAWRPAGVFWLGAPLCVCLARLLCAFRAPPLSLLPSLP